MATRIDYANSIDAPEMGTIYLTAAGYVNYPFKGISRESAMGWEEPVWGGELTRSLDFVLNIDDVDYGLVARLEISYKYMNVQDYIVLCAIAKQRVCTATYFNREKGAWVYDQEMAFTGNELGKLYKMGTKYLGAQDISIKLVATNRDRTSIINGTHTITYYANGGTGTIGQTTDAKWGGQQTLADAGFTKTGHTLAGWNTRADGTGLNYTLGQAVTIFGDLTLYAKWKANGTLLTVSTAGSYTLNIYKEDTQETNIYLNDTLVSTSTTSGSQDIPVTTTSANSVIQIESTGNWYFDNYCLGSQANNAYLTAIDTSSESKMTQIGTNAFRGARLTSINIPNSATTIGDSAFYNCTGLTSVTIPSSVTSIGSQAFQYCTRLTSITIPSSVTTIGDYAFRNTGLTSIIIPSGVTTIGQHAFNSCSSATSITIPSSVTSIGAYAFSYCTSLITLTIPSSVTNIGSYFCGHCTSLTTLNVYSSSSTTKATSEYTSWVYECTAEKLTIHALSTLNATTSQTAFGQYWNYIDENTMATTIYDL